MGFPSSGRMMAAMLIVTTAVAAASMPARAAQPLERADFEQLAELVKPASRAELLGEIPWGVDLWEARRQAAAEGKPILLWEMDGHPLGCT